MMKNQKWWGAIHTNNEGYCSIIRSMDYSREILDSKKYLTVRGALEHSGLTAPELKRAIALGFVTTAEIGTATFVEKRSLDEYSGFSASTAPSYSRAKVLASPFVPSSLRIEEDNHTDPKERAVFAQALERERGTVSSLSVAPYISVAALALFALILSIPTPSRDVGAREEAKAFFTQASIKEVTESAVSDVLARASEGSSGLAKGAPQSESRRTNPYAFSLEEQRAHALSAFFGSISEAIENLAVRVYESLSPILEGEAK
jgi:hypothetical protein